MVTPENLIALLIWVCLLVMQVPKLKYLFMYKSCAATLYYLDESWRADNG